MAKTFHAATGKFCGADSAKLVVKDGERFKVVRQHRRVGLPKAAAERAERIRRKASLAERHRRWEPVSSVLQGLIVRRHGV